MFRTAALPDPELPARAAAPGAWLTDGERAPPHLRHDDTLVAAVDLFQADPDLRLLPVIDAAGKPVGAVFEKDVRRLLLNPFGHALLRNPAYGFSVTPHLRRCPTAEVTVEIGALIDTYRRSDGSEGMIVTLNGRLFGVLANRRLIQLAAEHELTTARVRIARAQRIEAASERFERQIAAVVKGMSALSQQVERNAGDTADRASLAGDRATAVATAASQTSLNMGEIADRGRELARSLRQINANSVEARQAAAQANALVESGSARTQELMRSAQSIDSVIALISEIARQVNLLALNATIEAARAGEAGRGFTVVANEVKQLSTQTGSAAERITRHVREIRQAVDAVAEGHQHVERAIAAMAALAADVQDAVGTQERVTQTIAHNVDEAVEASNGIHHDVEAIGGTSHAASSGASELRDLAGRLRSDASDLSLQVGAFLAELRAA